MENQDKIYNDFKDAARKAERKSFDRMEAVWNRVEEKLDKKKRRPAIIWWKYAGVAAVALLFMTLGMFMLNEKDSPVAPNAIPENNVTTTVDTAKIKAAGDAVRNGIQEEVVDVEKASKPNAQGIVVEDSIYFSTQKRFTTSKNAKNPEYYFYTDKIKFVPGKKVVTEVTNMSVGDKLDEIVVTGYGTTRKSAATGAVSTASGYIDVNSAGRTYRDGDQRSATATLLSSERTKEKTMEGRPNANIIQSLQGQVPGLKIETGTGQLGKVPEVSPYDQYMYENYWQVGGGGEIAVIEEDEINKDGAPRESEGMRKRYSNVDTLSNGTYFNRPLPMPRGPLYVINGIPTYANVLNVIENADIQDLKILQSGEAGAIYGSDASHGAIIITTKKLSTKQTRKIKKYIAENDKLLKEQQINFIRFEQKQSEETEKVQVDQEEYESFIENQFENPATTPLSTFSIDVDNASYTNIRRFLNNGQVVPKDAVRVEEMINFFKYQYPQPKGDNPFSINTEYSDAPWNPKHKLLRIGLQGKEIATENLPASNFVFLIDVSGSMNADNKLPLLKQSMKLLVNQMRKEDRIAIVVYAGAAGLALPSTSGAQKEMIVTAIDNLEAGGSTAGGAGIELAYKTAAENFVKNGNNRVILATDGDFNVGASSNTDMQTLIEEKRKSGVFLTCLGYGMGNYKDSKLETLADKGNGNYAYIDNMQEADRFLQKEFKGSMYAIAKDVKIQIEFNPKHVQSYRLIGYENRKLRDEDFANDAIDAGELGSGHTVTALYEIIPVGVKSDFFPASPELKYSTPKAAAGEFNNELATIKFRHKKPAEDVSKEIVQVISNAPVPLETASGDFKFSAAVAWFGLKLRDSKLVTNKQTKAINDLAKEGLANDNEGYRAEFIRLVNMVQ